MKGGKEAKFFLAHKINYNWPATSSTNKICNMIHTSQELQGACKLWRLRRAWRSTLVPFLQIILYINVFLSSCSWLSDAEHFWELSHAKNPDLATQQPPIFVRTVCHVTQLKEHALALSGDGNGGAFMHPRAADFFNISYSADLPLAASEEQVRATAEPFRSLPCTMNIHWWH